MADVFISYSRENRDCIAQLAAALDADGFQVWWDRRLQSGDEFSTEIEREIEAARAVLVCWSASASASRWVRDEASAAADAGKLFALTLDGSIPPIGHRQYHAIDFSAWTGDPSDAPYPDLAATLRARVNGRVAPQAATPAPSTAAPARRTPAVSGVVLGSLVALAVIVAAIAAILRDPAGDAAASGQPGPGHAGQADPPAADPAGNAKSVAVLPFAVFSADVADSYFADGLADEVIHLLTRSPELRVAGRASSFEFKGQNIDLREIGRRLGVAHLIEGSVRKSGPRVRVTAQLIRTSDGFHLWSESYDRALVDVLAVQEDIARQIAARLGAPLSAPAGSHAKNRSADPEAYDSYLRGLSLFRNREDVEAAAAAFEDAVERDPAFAAAWAALADTYLAIPYWSASLKGEPPQITVLQKKAEQAAENAVALNASIAETHHARALVFRNKWRWAESEDALLKALAIEPGAAWLLEDYQEHLEIVGRYPDALRAIERAREIEPFNPFYGVILGISHWHLRDYDAAIKSMGEALEQDPDLAGFTIEYAALLADAGRMDEARSAVQACSSCDARARQRALEILDGRGAPYLDVASAAFGDLVFNGLAGGDEAVLAWLEARVGEGSTPAIYANSKAVAAVRPTERYAKLVRTLGLEGYWRERGWPPYCRPAGDAGFICSAE